MEVGFGLIQEKTEMLQSEMMDKINKKIAYDKAHPVKTFFRKLKSIRVSIDWGEFYRP